MRPVFLPYKMGSASAKALQQNLRSYRAKRVRHNGNYRPFRNHIIINWGSTQPAMFMARTTRNPAMFINTPSAVNIASNKLECFMILHNSGINIPDFTNDRGLVEGWLNNGHCVLARTAQGSHGRGIRIIHPGQELPDKPLYVKYVKKRDEYRVHVFMGEVIDIQRKMRTTRVPDDLVDWRVRNYDNGFVFGRSEVDPPEHILNNALQAVSSLRLHFGAVDIIHNHYYNESYVLEVNTAPGLQGTTLERYTQAIRRIL